MSVQLVLFFVFAGLAVAGAVSLVLQRHPIRSALSLIVVMVALAALYLLQGADFIAAVQIIVYAGAVLTLFLFVIMMIGVDKDEDMSESLPFHRPLIGGLALLTLVIGGMLAIGGRFDWVPASSGLETPPNGTVEALAGRLFTDWVLAFEVTAILLTIAAAGAIVLAYFRRSEPAE